MTTNNKNNSGNWNSGDWNSGNWNSGDWNSGNWNSGNRNSGYCNSDTPSVRIFNKDTEIERDNLTFPNFFYFDTNTWVDESKMSDKEKEAYPSYVTCGGYLKCRTQQQAWRESWDKAGVEDRTKVMYLPNWDNEIFKEISGIDVEKELNIRNEKEDIIEITLEEIAKLKGIDVSKLRIKE